MEERGWIVDEGINVKREVVWEVWENLGLFMYGRSRRSG